MMGVEINQFNHTVLINRHINLVNSNTYWHQIQVENVEGLDRDAVLKPIMRFCKPDSFIPVQYTSFKNNATFLIKNCGPAIQKLSSQNLILINPYNNDKPFKISIKLCYASSNELKINIHLNLTSVLHKRVSYETGTLNLDNFAKDTELEEYCALSQQKLFFYVMHLAKNIPFKVLKLSHNDIDSLSPMEALEGVKHSITIDLRNNCIKEISELDYFKHLNVIELWLDGNPICDNYTEITYGKSIKDHVKKLEKLDGVSVIQQFPPFRRNFLCNLTGYDLVDQFLEHYFTLYDTWDRSVLGDMYHRDALFSLTSMYIPSQTTSSAAQLIPYKKVSRNLKQMSDFSKNAQDLFIGPNPIIKVLSSLPLTEHDPYSFTADLMMYTEKVAVIVVGGVFRECSALLEAERLLGFTRNFVLLTSENGEYLIINEMLNVTNATRSQASRAFKQIKAPRLQWKNLPRAQNDKELQDMINAMKAITGLKTDWARKCLEECKCDLTEALKLFIELFKKDKIPKSALISEPRKKEALTKKSSVPIKEPVFSITPIEITKRMSQSPPSVLSTASPLKMALRVPLENGPPEFSKYLSDFKEVQQAPEVFIDLTGSTEDSKFKKKENISKRKLKRIQDVYKMKGHKEACKVVQNILRANGVHYEAFEEVFMWYYKTNVEEARQMKEKIMDLSRIVKPFLSERLLVLLIAICECMYGDFSVGESKFQEMFTVRQKWTRPITEFCKVLLKKNQVDEAKLFLQPFLKEHPIKYKIRRIVRRLNSEYKVNLW